MKALHFSVVIVVVVINWKDLLAEGGDDTDIVPHEKRLFADLVGNSSGYNKFIRPVHNVSETITVQFGMALIQILGVVESKETVDFVGWLRKQWTDDSLKWDPKQYGGVDLIRIPANLLWMPDIELFNGNIELSVYYADVLAVVNHNGVVLFIPPVRGHISCSMDLRNYPYDEQTCYLKFGSWTYDGFKVDVNFYNGQEQLDMTDYMENKWFTVTETSAVKNMKWYPCCPEPYPDLTFTLRLRREGTFAVHLALVPATIMCLLIPAVFLLPPGDGTKITLGVGILLSDVLLLNLLVGEVMDFAHPVVPNIAKYYLATMILVSLSLVLSALVENLWKKHLTGKEVPGIIRKVLLGCFGRVLCVSHDSYMVDNHEPGVTMSSIDPGHEATNDPDEIRMLPKSQHTSAEWKQLATVVDRLLFIVFLVVSLITAVAMGHK